MSTINSLRMVLQYAIDYLEIVPGSAETSPYIAAVSQLISAYDALAPDWSQAPDGAEWFTIDANGEGNWHVEEPEYNEWRCRWFSAWPHSYGGTVVIPLGIDWRLLKWQRPEVAA